MKTMNSLKRQCNWVVGLSKYKEKSEREETSITDPENTNFPFDAKLFDIGMKQYYGEFRIQGSPETPKMAIIKKRFFNHISM